MSAFRREYLEARGAEPLVILDLGSQGPQRLPLRVVPVCAAIHNPQVVGAEVRADCLADGIAVLGAYDEHDPVHAHDLEDGLHRPGEDGNPVHGQQDLVDVSTDPGAGPGREELIEGWDASRTVG